MTVQRPRVSVIVPTYNRAASLERAIESIFAQSVAVDDVVIVDDGSTDDTRSLVERLRASRFEWKGRCQYLWQEHAGKSVALNRGLQAATGDWIAFNDSDDWWRPEKLELQFRALGQFESAGACFTDARFVNNPSMQETAFDMALLDRTSPFGIRHDIASLYASTSQPIYMQTLLVSRDVMRRFGEFDPTFFMGMDTDLAFRLGLLTPMCYVNAPLVEIDRTESRTVGLMTEFPFNSIDRLHVHERMIARWIEMTKASHPELGPRLRERLIGAQNVLADHYLVKEEFQTARSILGRAARSSRRPNMVAKFVWSVIAPRSLRRKIVRHHESRRVRPAILALIAFMCCLASGSAQKATETELRRAARWAEWVEPDFPFFSSVIDAGRAGAGFPARNLTPRGLVLKIGPDQWVGFDTDLLRVAAMWRGRSMTAKALAPGSYHQPDKKTGVGQTGLPEPDGKVWLANGIYPGWQTGERPAFTDPREPAPSPEEVGRGPLPEAMGRFKALRQVRNGVVLEYTAGGADVREHMSASERNRQWTVIRHFRVGPSSHPLWLMLGTHADEVRLKVTPETLALDQLAGAGGGGAGLASWTVRVPAHGEPLDFSVEFTNGAAFSPVAPAAMPSDAPATRWREEVVTGVTRSNAKDAYVVDDIQLPVDNPWRRNVRLSDIQFLKDGTGVSVTLDGDVWFVRGLAGTGGTVRWRRFASGLHEPLSLAIRDDKVYVFDRNGIWRLTDTNGDGEADLHEMFSNAFAQTADNREFPSTVRLAPGGEFVIAKGGQEATTIGKHNGSVLRISADGRQATVLGYGLRQPELSVNIRTGLVIASDQQGNYVPSTPLHIVRDRQFYGFLSDKLPREQYPAPIADPITWIPHAANASAMSQVWLFDARMGPLNDALVHIGYSNPELFRVLLNNRTPKPQGAVVSVTRAFDYPPLNGSVNPVDGQLYLAGFQIFGWGTTATRQSGLGRVRYTGAVSTLPSEVVAMDKGLLVRFDTALDPAKAANPDNYSVTSWKYQRTYQYGSPQFKADGTPGIDRLAPSHAYVSKDGRSVFIAVPDMKPVMQMRLGWSLATSKSAAFENSAYFTPYELPAFDPVAEGFGVMTVDLSPRAVAAAATTPVTVAEGRRVSQLYGCIACHSIDPTISMLGPTWKGLYGSARSYAKGTQQAVADEAYLRESILDPAAKIATGYERGEAGMPSYAGVLTPAQIESIILYIKSLR